MMDERISRPKRRYAWLMLSVLAILIAVAGTYQLTRPRPANLVAALEANQRGIGFMHKFDYARAAEAFGEAAAAAPDWTPARINQAIALYNLGGGAKDKTDQRTDMDKAAEIFRRILAAEPDNIPAHYNLGIIALFRNEIETANTHFTRVSQLDPTDDFTWLMRFRSLPDGSETEAGRDYLLKALEVNPYLNPARYSLAQHLLTTDADRVRLMDEFGDLSATHGDVEYAEKYSEMGRYALVLDAAPPTPAAVGPVPMFIPREVLITPPPVWATRTTLGPGAEADLRRAVWKRFGGTLVSLDFNRDGRPDFLVLSAVIRDGQPADLLLRNDGDGRFTDVTTTAGLTGASLGVAVGDYDNDGFVDLVLTSSTGAKLWRNKDGAAFEDVSADAGLASLPTGVYLGAAWSDLDLDGDLDLLLARYGTDVGQSAAGLAGGPTPEGGGVVALVNIGESRAEPVGAKVAPLLTAFAPADRPPALLRTGPVTSFTLGDLDGDLDPDLLIYTDDQPPAVVLNDRLMRFRAGPPLPNLPADRYNGGLVFDANGDDQSDLAVLSEGKPPVLLVSQRATRDTPDELATRFQPATTNAPRLVSAQTYDLDRDGRFDLVGRSAEGLAFIQNEGSGRLVSRPDPFSPDAAAVSDLLAMQLLDATGNCHPDLLLWSEAGGLKLFSSSGNGNQALSVTLSGIRERREPMAARTMRTNADGLGTRIWASAGAARPSAELTTLSTGLGQSVGAVELGLGPASQAEFVRLRWPDALLQAELGLPACQPLLLTETSRKPTSCPVLLVWDGTQFVYITDCLGAGALGEVGPTGALRPPRPSESVAIPPGHLAPHDGIYTLKIAEPMDEVLYLDSAELLVIDHPAEWRVLPDERFVTSEPYPTEKLLAFRDDERIFSAKATDHRGTDVTAILREHDRRRVEGFAKRSWMGYAEEHFVELDFADRLQALPPSRAVYLVLAGWTDYPYPESIYAATQAGVLTTSPTLEQKQPDGTWKFLADVGFPAGLPRVITRDISGLIDPTGGPVRIRTNLQIYWDQISICPLAAEPEALTLSPKRAVLQHRGFMQEISTGGRGPIAYDDSRLEPVAVTNWQGRLTRLGDVTPLLQSTDDRLAICGPGDELIVDYDASALPLPPTGQVRSFVLRLAGYCKDTAPTTLTGGQVGPIPFRAMPTYPYPADTKRPPEAVAADAEWHTRPARGGR